MSFGDRFWSEFNKSTIVSGLLALGVWAGILYLATTGQEIPDALSAGGSLILGYFFGSRSGQQAERISALNAYAKGGLARGK